MSEIEDLRRDVIELRDWKEAVLSKCKASSGWDDMEWGGDKEGWGFVHYFIGHLNTRALQAAVPRPEVQTATPAGVIDITSAYAYLDSLGTMAAQEVAALICVLSTRPADTSEREAVARIIDPHSFLPYSDGDELVGQIVEDSKQDALRKADAILALGAAQAQQVPDGYRAAWLEMIEHCNALKADRFRLEQTIRDSIEALERNSTSAPVVECLKAALPVPSATRGSGAAMIDNMTPEQIANWTDDGDCNAGAVALTSTNHESPTTKG